MMLNVMGYTSLIYREIHQLVSVLNALHFCNIKHVFTIQNWYFLQVTLRLGFKFEIFNFSISSYGVYISQLIHFSRVCSHVDDFNNRNNFLTS